MKQMTVCFLVRHAPEREVLLGFKKVGFGAGKYAGIGGKVEAGETVEAAAMREVEEEIGVQIPAEALQQMGTVTFIFPFRPDWSQEIAIFMADNWEGEPCESAEMLPAWFRPPQIPYHSMWQDAIHWLPRILSGTKINARISFQEDNETVAGVSDVP